VSSADGDPSPFRYAGLRQINPDGSIVAKAAPTAFRQAASRLEGCAKVATTACH
jgi:hypothetical protein